MFATNIVAVVYFYTLIGYTLAVSEHVYFMYLCYGKIYLHQIDLVYNQFVVFH